MERAYARHYEESATVPAPPEAVFAALDDHVAFSRHMAEPNWRTLWSSMRVGLDEGGGRRVGSHIEMESRILGFHLYLDEVVTRREPPRVKEWETTGDVRLLVIGHYRMRAEIRPEGAASGVRVRIDHDLPARNAWLGRMLGGMYAKWCVRQMIGTLAAAFSHERTHTVSAPAGKAA